MDPLKMYFLLNMGIFHCHVSLPEGKTIVLYSTCILLYIIYEYYIYLGGGFKYCLFSPLPREMIEID